MGGACLTSLAKTLDVNKNKNGLGFVYALQSDNCDFLKVGMTNVSPGKRLAEINSSKNYGPLGPWRQITSILVVDARTVELGLHRQFKDVQCTSHAGCVELFSVTPDAVRQEFANVPLSYKPDGINIEKLNVDQPFLKFLIRLFEVSGLENFMDQQEAWTFTLYPSTAGGRYFTLNIGKHEVAFSRPIRGKNGDEDSAHHMIFVDELVARDASFLSYLRSKGGRITNSDPYASALPYGCSINFDGNFDDVLGIFDQPTLRRGLAAYWYDALLGLRDRGSRSFFARFHNHNAVTQIMDQLRQARAFEKRKIHRFEAPEIE